MSAPGLVKREFTANVANCVNASGTATNIGYDAYGKVEGTGVSDPFGYGGQWGYTTETGGRDTGFILCTHRYYDPANGRWLTRDPIGYDGGVNLYGYVGGDPVNAVDPEGLFSIRHIFQVIKDGLSGAWTYLLPDVIGGPLTVITSEDTLTACKNSPQAICSRRQQICLGEFVTTDAISKKCRNWMNACHDHFPREDIYDIRTWR